MYFETSFSPAAVPQLVDAQTAQYEVGSLARSEETVRWEEAAGQGFYHASEGWLYFLLAKDQTCHQQQHDLSLHQLGSDWSAGQYQKLAVVGSETVVLRRSQMKIQLHDQDMLVGRFE